MHGLKQSSPTWPSSLSPKLRLPSPSPAFPTSQSCSQFRGPRGLLCSCGDCGILVLVCLLKDFMGGGAGISCPLRSLHPLSLLSLCPCAPILSAVTSCAQASPAAVPPLPGPPSTYPHQFLAMLSPEGSGKNCWERRSPTIPQGWIFPFGFVILFPYIAHGLGR